MNTITGNENTILSLSTDSTYADLSVNTHNNHDDELLNSIDTVVSAIMTSFYLDAREEDLEWTANQDF